jgi:hypothetical protein
MRIGGCVWHSKRISDNNAEIAEYDFPKEYITRPNYLTIMPAISRGYMEVAKYGEDLENTWTVIANRNAFDGVFKVGDILWVDGETPFDENKEDYAYGETANAIVKSVSEVNHTINITLTRNKERYDNGSKVRF